VLKKIDGTAPRHTAQSQTVFQ